MTDATGRGIIQAPPTGPSKRVRRATQDDMAPVPGGTLPESSQLGLQRVSPFFLGRVQVTWGEWQTVRAWAEENGYDLRRVGRGSATTHPVHSVTWHEALKWCNARSEMHQLTPVYSTARGAVYRRGTLSPRISAAADGYRLPTEVEWEWAARGATVSEGSPYSGSHEIDAVAWYFGNSSGAPVDLERGRGTWPVRQKAPNELGVHDMSGNVAEWCVDEVARDGVVAVRGGGWSSKAAECTVFDRSGSTPGTARRSTIGLRLALDAPGVDHDRMLGLFGDLNFGDVAVGSESTRTLTLRNYSDEALSVTGVSLPAGFAGDWAGGSIPAGEARPVAVTFAPALVQAHTGQCTVHAAAGTWSKEISGTGTVAAQDHMVVVPGGTLPGTSQLAGAAAETFEIGRHEVTWQEWTTVRDAPAAYGYDLHTVGAGTDDLHPVRNISWFDAVKWCNARSENEGLTPVYTVSGHPYRTGETVPARNADADGYRLLTEVEWEWAARGGAQSQGFTYSGSDDLDDVAWYRDNSAGAATGLAYGGGGTWPVGQKAPNELGLHDMSGNIAEWCWDAAGGPNRSHRGGNWHFLPDACTVAQRGGFDAATRAEFFGLRVARRHRPDPAGMVDVEGGALPALSELGPVRVDPFSLSRTEVTWEQWLAVRSWAVDHGYDLHDVGQASAGDHPVRGVDWYHVVKWCNARSEMEGLTPVYLANGVPYRSGETVPDIVALATGHRLPTEAEWEWAARGGLHGHGYRYSGSDDADDVAWYHGNNSPTGTKPVATKAANELGLHDMSGNVWEWCWDEYRDDDGGTFRRVRGGGWVSGSQGCAVDFRFQHRPDETGGNLGFRSARNRTPDGMIAVEGGALPPASVLDGQQVDSYYLNRHLITWREWMLVRDWASGNGYDLHVGVAAAGSGSADDHPVRNVSWFDAVKWCNARTEMEGLLPVYRVAGAIYRSGRSVPAEDAGANGYRLPTEAEWEWAARGGVDSEGFTYSGSDHPGTVAWYDGNSEGAAVALAGARGTWPVGHKAPNELGFHDMSGNVIEWCWDPGGGWEPQDGLPYRRARGGSFMHSATACEVAHRMQFEHSPAVRLRWFGLRPARSQSSASSGGMALVQGGRLPDASPLGRKWVSHFIIGREEVTWEQWRTVRVWAVDHGYDLAAVGDGVADNHPVQSVSWHDAVKWCNAKSEMEQLPPVYLVGDAVYRSGISVPTVDHAATGFRLPTEAEWEWAARGGVQSQGYTYSGSDDLDDVAWYWTGVSLPSANRTKPIGLKLGNELGLHDMTGNVWEWCWETWIADDPAFRVLRGASWSTSDINANCAVVTRHHAAADARTDHVGLRLARNGHPPDGMVRVSGGSMPSCSSLAGAAVSPVFVSRHAVTWDEWQPVRQWAINNGYWISTGAGSAGDHPVRDVNWYDVVKWCNAKSELEGLTPVYTAEVQQYPGTANVPYFEVFRTGEYGWGGHPFPWIETTGSWNDPMAQITFHMDGAADGYRLPTHVEWEWAARGGALSECFVYSGGDDIESVAWYLGNSSGAAVDLEIGTHNPFMSHAARGTWPVGQKLPNELALYDMTGNVAEWIWDRTSTQRHFRQIRGGSWSSTAESMTLSGWYSTIGVPIRPHSRYTTVGFRTVRRVGA